MSVAEFKNPVEAKAPANNPTPINSPAPTPTEIPELKPKITVVGVGGAGGNAVNNMIRSKLEGVKFVICNTDAQAITQSLAERRIQLGDEVTQGLGAGSRPEVGRAAAEESLERLIHEISGSNMVFITAGMGGGTGTGAAPVIAQAARERGILTVAVVTKPFHFEGNHRMRTAEQGIEELSQYVDTLIIIPNQNLFRVANEKTTFAEAFKMADDVLHSGVRGVTDLMMMPGLINLDFADIRAVMSEMGKAMMGTGEASGEGRAIMAAEAAISNPLLDDVSMKGAQGVLINITGGLDMTLYEVDEAAKRVAEEVDPDANIIFGSTFDEKMKGIMRVSVVATGIESDTSKARVQRYRLDRDPRILRAVPGSPFPSDQNEELDDQSEPTSGTSENAEQDTTAQTPASPEPQHTEQFEEDANYNPDEQSYAHSKDDYYHPRYMPQEAVKPQKRGFFSRLAETMRGGASREERTELHTPEQIRRAQEEAARYYTEVTENQKAGDQNVQDIPAYLRRNKKS